MERTEKKRGSLYSKEVFGGGVGPGGRKGEGFVKKENRIKTSSNSISLRTEQVGVEGFGRGENKKKQLAEGGVEGIEGGAITGRISWKGEGRPASSSFRTRSFIIQGAGQRTRGTGIALGFSYFVEK